MFGEELHFLEKENDDVDEDQTAQAQGEKPDEFREDVPMEDPVTANHGRQAPSTCIAICRSLR
jgi:hypothetical protein